MLGQNAKGVQRRSWMRLRLDLKARAGQEHIAGPKLALNPVDMSL